MTCTCHDILLHHVWRLQDSVVPGPQECDSVVYEGLVQHHTCILRSGSSNGDRTKYLRIRMRGDREKNLKIG